MHSTGASCTMLGVRAPQTPHTSLHPPARARARADDRPAGLMGPLFLKQAVDALGSTAAAAAADPLSAAVKAVVSFGLCSVLQHLSKVRGGGCRPAPLPTCGWQPPH